MLFLEVYLLTIIGLSFIKCEEDKCDITCEVEKSNNLICTLDPKTAQYIVFPGKCAFQRHVKCYDKKLEETSLEFCIKAYKTRLRARRLFGDSCPVFCPKHYRPVCAATEGGYYNYRTFINGCNLDLVNCRGNFDMPSYIEVPLNHCSRHLMKNIFAEQIIFSNAHDYPDYF